jgi:hypothetical protein
VHWDHEQLNCLDRTNQVTDHHQTFTSSRDQRHFCFGSNAGIEFADLVALLIERMVTFRVDNMLLDALPLDNNQGMALRYAGNHGLRDNLYALGEKCALALRRSELRGKKSLVVPLDYAAQMGEVGIQADLWSSVLLLDLR